MTVPIEKPAPTRADYKAAEERLRQVRDEAAARVAESQANGDVAAGNEWASRLRQEFEAFKCVREALPPEIRRSINADRILDSFSKDERGVVRLVIPADVSDEEAMRALNYRYLELFPFRYGDRDAIYEPDISKALDAGNGCGRRSSGPRVINLIGMVPDTANLTWEQQEEAVRQQGLTLPHPIEQVLAAAAYACRIPGEDIFNHYYARGSVAEVAVCLDIKSGIRIYRSFGGQDFLSVASGSLPRK